MLEDIDKYLQNSEEVIFHLEWYIQPIVKQIWDPNGISSPYSSKYEIWINLFLDMQVIKKFTSHAPFLRKVLEDIFQQIKKINQK